VPGTSAGAKVRRSQAPATAEVRAFAHRNRAVFARNDSRVQKWIFLTIAIVSEVTATSTLKATAGFSKIWPSIVVVIGYGSAFYFLSLTLTTIPVGIAYAIWSGAGTILITLIAWIFMSQRLDLPALAGVLIIVSGVILINLFSKSSAH
jgi:small multidrug resistance pump